MYSDLAAPIVTVPKQDGSVRICGDYKVTVNPTLDIDQYPLPRPEDLMTCVSVGRRFTKLHLSSAYQQTVLKEEHHPFVTINMHHGLYRFTSNIPESTGCHPPGTNSSNFVPG